MHIRIEGMVSIKDAIEVLSEALHMLSEHGVTSVSDMNFYCSIYDENGEEREVLGANGNEVGILYKANTNPKPIEIPVNPRSKANPRFRSVSCD